MGTLYVTEYASAANAQVGGSATGQVAQEPPLARQTVSIGAGSVKSAAFNAATTLIRLHTDEICSCLFGLDPTALTTDARYVAGQTEYHAVPRGQGFKVAVIANL